MRGFAATALIAFLLPAAVGASGDPPAAETLWLEGSGLKLKTTVYESGRRDSRAVLVVVLHGDLLGFREIPAATYHYVFANAASRKIDDVVVAAVLRPGYRDASGERSEGQQGLATGDNYTPEVVQAVAGVIERLKERYHPAHTVLVGHSGGAAISADLLAKAPRAVDGALLISCPCDLGAWREHMARLQHNSAIWSAPIRGLSPQELAGGVPAGVHVSMLAGEKDDVAPPEMSRRYAEVLRKRLRFVRLMVAPGLGHELLLEPVAYEELKRLVESVRSRG